MGLPSSKGGGGKHLLPQRRKDAKTNKLERNGFSFSPLRLRAFAAKVNVNRSTPEPGTAHP